MYTTNVTYKNKEGHETIRTLHFQLNWIELLALDKHYGMSLAEKVRKAEEKRDANAIRNIYALIIGYAYGEPITGSEELFKDTELHKIFVKSDAFKAFYTRIMNDPKEAEEFIMAITPRPIGGRE